MDEALLRRILDEKLKDVEKKEDIQEVRAKLDEHEEGFTERKMENSRLAARTSTGSRASTSTTAPAPTYEWRPRLVHIKGFAPYGCGQGREYDDARCPRF